MITHTIALRKTATRDCPNVWAVERREGQMVRLKLPHDLPLEIHVDFVDSERDPGSVILVLAVDKKHVIKT